MGWSIGYDENHKRDIGYGVPSICDHPDCDKEIDRGLSYVCGNEPYGGENGCGLFFCWSHLTASSQCERCDNKKEPFPPKPDTKECMRWKLTDESWQKWRDENQNEVSRIKVALLEGAGE